VFSTSGAPRVVESTQPGQRGRHVGGVLSVKLASFPKVSEALCPFDRIVPMKVVADICAHHSQEFMQIMKGVDLVWKFATS
jgi:hypothetical protein